MESLKKKDRYAKYISIQKLESSRFSFETLVSKKELVVAFGVSGSFISKLMTEERLPHFKIGRAVRFRVSEISTWLEKRRVS